jgi:hypothetical protein
LAGLSVKDLKSEIEAGWGGRYPAGEFRWHTLEAKNHHYGELSEIFSLLGREGLNV